tara:strand:+ start:177 stop:344 length:168 start_codon:yes stop_codon:yes gene_type:complete
MTIFSKKFHKLGMPQKKGAQKRSKNQISAAPSLEEWHCNYAFRGYICHSEVLFQN